jgi:biopolymer transport protein ExbB/TolQ
MVALSNLRNLGEVGDVDDILRSQADNDESGLETSYAMLGAFVWAIPVLGFIGTVEGLSIAIGGFSSVLTTAADLDQIKAALQGVTGGLATAFETTFQALVLALIIQLWLVYLKKSEEEFLDACGDYCLRHVVNRLRIVPFQTQQL